jgi:hypothetical protein
VASLDGGPAGRGAGGGFPGGGGGLVRACLNESMRRSRTAALNASSTGRAAAAAVAAVDAGGDAHEDVQSLRASVAQLNALVTIKIRSLVGGGDGGALVPEMEASGFSMRMGEDYARAQRAVAAQSQELGGEDDDEAWADEDGAMLAHSQVRAGTCRCPTRCVHAHIQ